MDDTDPNLEIVDAMHAPLCDASESEINALVDEVLKTGKHLTLPTNDNSATSERFHARAIADQMQRLAHQLGPTPDAIVDGPDDCDEWWFEVDARRLGPISLRKARYLWEDGVLTPDSLCWHEGFLSWVSLFRVSELAEALAPRTASPSERLGAAASVEAMPQAAPPSETNWIPNAGAALEAANRERLAASQPRPQPEVQPPPPLSLASAAAQSVVVDDAPTLLHVETIPPAESSADSSPSPKKRRRKNRLTHVIVNGVAKGVAVAAAMVALRFLLPHAGIDTPLVVVMREPQAATANAAPSAPSPASPTLVAAAVSPMKPRKQAEPVRPKHATPAVVPAKTVAHPKPAAPMVKPASKPAPASSKPASNEDAFAQEFAPDQDALETSEIFEVVAAHKPEVSDCIREQKAVAPQRSGRLVMRWWVQLDGRVTDVEVRSPDLADQPLAECLRKQIAGWTFPKHEVPHAAIDFPFVF